MTIKIKIYTSSEIYFWTTQAKRYTVYMYTCTIFRDVSKLMAGWELHEETYIILREGDNVELKIYPVPSSTQQCPFVSLNWSPQFKPLTWFLNIKLADVCSLEMLNSTVLCAFFNSDWVELLSGFCCFGWCRKLSSYQG